MALMSRFDTPAGLRDVDAGSPFYDRWHEVVNGIIKPFTRGAGSGGYL